MWLVVKTEDILILATFHGGTMELQGVREMVPMKRMEELLKKIRRASSQKARYLNSGLDEVSDHEMWMCCQLLLAPACLALSKQQLLFIADMACFSELWQKGPEVYSGKRLNPISGPGDSTFDADPGNLLGNDSAITVESGSSRSLALDAVGNPDSTQDALWPSMPTVEMHGEAEISHEQEAGEQTSCCNRAWWLLQGWLLAIMVGICSSLSGAGLDVGVQGLSSVRFGVCSPPWIPFRHCPEDSWIYWGHGMTGYAFNVGFGTLWAFISGMLVYAFAPAAAGSGIPEVKTILNGFVMADVVSWRTLLIKVPGLMLSVAAGMSLGKEGPLVHVAVCWAQLLSRAFPQFANEAKRRELFSAAAAAGVSTAFGAPLGGVLFSLEEVSSFFPSRTLIKSFTAAMAAAIVLSVLNTTNTKGLTLFSVEYSTACHPIEYFIFAVLGVVGGLIGAVFNSLNVRWSAFRMTPAFRKRVHPVLEVTCIALVTLLSSFPLAMTRVLSSDAIHALFEACDAGSGHQLRGHLKLCTADDAYAKASASLLMELLLAALIRLLQTILTFGVPCPAGLFVPSLFTGAAIGRFVGVIVQAANHERQIFPRTVEPGVYAMVGAAAVLGGVCRVTISLVAIMLELTGGMTYIVPFMIDHSVMRMSPDASLGQAHKVFKQLGCKRIFLVGSMRGNSEDWQPHGALLKEQATC
ncbi:unnamed protein product [Durusdinium trenchii]|uniref:Chloride channel protein n=1 Tax=Durusdinium trenchii TaxID=1381693 RepID=A0ABP0PAM1_9DINO